MLLPLWAFISSSPTTNINLNIFKTSSPLSSTFSLINFLPNSLSFRKSTSLTNSLMIAREKSPVSSSSKNFLSALTYFLDNKCISFKQLIKICWLMYGKLFPFKKELMNMSFLSPIASIKMPTISITNPIGMIFNIFSLLAISTTCNMILLTNVNKRGIFFTTSSKVSNNPISLKES